MTGPEPPTPAPEVLLEQARAWMAEDPDPRTRAELTELLERPDGPDLPGLADRFASGLQFGTAGLRGAMGAGPNRMNRVVVTRAAAGLAAFVLERARAGSPAGPVDPGAVVIGYDARHLSDTFARDTAEVVAGAGLTALVLPRALPTPVLAFAVRHLGAAAGVMVTASHNPAADNGYKVYLGGPDDQGSQIVPPVDEQISAHIRAVGPLAGVARGTEWLTLGDEVLEAYLARATSLVDPASPRQVRVVYTAMHGVGASVATEALRRVGFTDVAPVLAQCTPDPDFPTVAFPNPEEPGALDLAFAQAQQVDADLVIANDPDADRCAVAVADRDGQWRRLSGDEVGALLAVHLVHRQAGSSPAGTMATTIVSSSMLGQVARANGLGYAETLTGFKFVSRVPGLVFGYEEALGYCVDPQAVRDKDGITAALLIAELAAVARAAGRTLLDELDAIDTTYGVHATRAVSYRVTDLAVIPSALHRLHSDPPVRLGGLPVEQAEDLSAGVDGLPPTDGVRYRLSHGVRVVVRPSGTEPKLKCYLEAVEQPDPDVAGARARAGTRLDGVQADLAVALGL